MDLQVDRQRNVKGVGIQNLFNYYFLDIFEQRRDNGTKIIQW